MAIALAWVGVCVLLFFSNFAESAITSVSGAKLKGLKTRSDARFWAAASRWLHHPEEYLTLLLLLQNLLESFYVWLLLMGLVPLIADFHLRQAAVWLLGTAVSLPFLTLYPKILARKLSHGMVGVWVLAGLYWILTPFYPFLRFFFAAVAKLTGGQAASAGALGREVALTLEEIGELLDLGRRGEPAAAPLELHMMANYLKLKTLRVGQIMTRRESVSSVDRETLEAPEHAPHRDRAIFQVMTDGHTRTLVVSGGLPSGYLHAKDVFREAVRVGDPAKVDWSGLVRPIPAVHAHQTVLGALPLLLRAVPMAYVVDGGCWAGIVTSEDFLEEITGEILDEFEPRKRRRAPARS